MLTLNMAKQGLYRITRFSPSSEEHLRLMELGFKAGERVTILEKAPFSGPVKVCVKNSRFAVWSDDAKHIHVEPCLDERVYSS